MADAKSDRESTNKPFFERSLFRATVAVVGLLGAIWAFSGIPEPWELGDKLFGDSSFPLRNTEIILDASERMGARFEGETKLDVAAAAVTRWAAAGESSGLALRRAGGSCAESTSPLVDFDDGQSKEIAEEAEAQEPGGESNWGLAVRTAIEEFGEERFHQPGAENQIVIFVGGGDECGEQVGEEIHNQLAGTDIKAEFQFFALDVSAKERSELRAIKQQLEPVADVLVEEAESGEELEEAVDEVKEEEEEAGASPGEETTTPEEEETEPGEETETRPEGEESTEAEEEPIEPEAPEESIPPEEAALPPGKALSSVLRSRPMTLSWTTRPSGPSGRENWLFLHWGSFRGFWSSMPS